MHADPPRTSTQQRPAFASKQGQTVGLFSRTIISKAEAAQSAIAAQRTAAPSRGAPSAAGDQAYREPHTIGHAASRGVPEPHAIPYRQHGSAMSWESVPRSAPSDARLPRPSAPLSSPFAASPLPTPRPDSALPRHMPGLHRETDHGSARTRFYLPDPYAVDASHVSGLLVDELVYGEASTVEEVSALLACDLRRGKLWARPPSTVDTGGARLDRAWSLPPAAAERSEVQFSHSAPLRYTDADGLRHYLQPFGGGCRTDTDDEDEDEDDGYDDGGGISVCSTAGRHELHLPLRYPTAYY